MAHVGHIVTMNKSGSSFPGTKSSLRSTLTVDDASDDSIFSQNEHFIERLTRTIPDILYVYEIEGRRLIYLNRQISKVLGYSKADIQKMGDALIDDLLHPTD